MLMNEKRSAERISYQGTPHGQLYLRLSDQRLTVQRILDISNTGIRVEIQESVGVGKKVALEYIDDDIKIEVFGTVARVTVAADTISADSEAATTGFLAGIALMSPMTLIAMIQAGNHSNHHRPA